MRGPGRQAARDLATALVAIALLGSLAGCGATKLGATPPITAPPVAAASAAPSTARSPDPTPVVGAPSIAPVTPTSPVPSVAPASSPSPAIRPTTRPRPAATPGLVRGTPAPTPVRRPRWDAPASGLRFDAASFTLRRMAPASRWYAERSPYRLTAPCTCDAEGVPVRIVAGRATYHPVNVADHALWLIDSFRQTGARAYLDRAIRDAERLRTEAVLSGGALFYPYRFDWATGPWRLEAPWYSAMAQGEVLSVMVALAEITDQARFRAWADQTFAAFALGRRAGRPWVSYADVSGHLWLEEYPVMPAGHVLNGMMFAILGIADYASLTGDATARRFAAGALTTIQRLADDYRRPGRNSAYYLDGPSTSDHYHAVVIWQLRYLGRLTGDAAFGALADRFLADRSVSPYRVQPAGSGGWPAVPAPTATPTATPAPTPAATPPATPPPTATPRPTATPPPTATPTPAATSPPPASPDPSASADPSPAG